jgi:protein-disulfide isomerase
MSMRLKLILGGLVVILLAGVLIGASQLGARDKAPSAGPIEADRAQTTEVLLRGIPQRGAALGSPSAPVTLVEYADIQCPYCGEWARNVFPELVQGYVRTGKLRIVFRGLAFLGPDSFTALQTTVAAGQQGRLWQVLHLLFEHQGPENMGWADEELLRSAVSSAGIDDAEAVLRLRDSGSVDAAIKTSARLARAAGITGTPSFEIGPTGGRLHRLHVTSLATHEFTSAIESTLAK